MVTGAKGEAVVEGAGSGVAGGAGGEAVVEALLQWCGVVVVRRRW